MSGFAVIPRRLEIGHVQEILLASVRRKPEAVTELRLVTMSPV